MIPMIGSIMPEKRLRLRFLSKQKRYNCDFDALNHFQMSNFDPVIVIAVINRFITSWQVAHVPLLGTNVSFLFPQVKFDESDMLLLSLSILSAFWKYPKAGKPSTLGNYAQPKEIITSD